MVGINFSDNIHARGRKLYLQTHSSDDNNKIISTLFDGGRVLCTEECLFNSSELVADLKGRVEAFHMEKISAIELLYSISTRVKTVRHPLSLNKLGLQYLRWHLLDEAISEFELAIQYDLSYSEAYLNLGEALLRRGGLEEAEQTLLKGVQVAPAYADMWHKLGVAFLRQKKLRKALNAFNKALKINPAYDEPHLSIAISLLEIIDSGIEEKGIPGVTDCKRLVKEHLGRAAAVSIRFQTADFEDAMRKFHKGDVKQALTILQHIAQNLPKVVDLNFHDYFYLNYMYGEEGRSAETVQKYVRKLEGLVKEYPDFPDLHNFLGIAYLIQCRHLFNKSLHQFQTAVDINPKFEKAINHLKLAKNDGKGLLILLRAMLK